MAKANDPVEPTRPKVLTAVAAISAATAIGAAAFGAHGASDPQAAAWLRTGGEYQLAHAIAALVIGALHSRIGWAMLGGAGLFAATLYAMAVGAPRWLGAITPIGGVVLIMAWLSLAACALRQR